MTIKHGGVLSVAMAGILALALVGDAQASYNSVSYRHLRAHETLSYRVCRLLLEK